MLSEDGSKSIIGKPLVSLRGLKKRAGSIVVRRRGRTFVVNKKDPRQKARQG